MELGTGSWEPGNTGYDIKKHPEEGTGKGQHACTCVVRTQAVPGQRDRQQQAPGERPKEAGRAGKRNREGRASVHAEQSAARRRELRINPQDLPKTKEGHDGERPESGIRSPRIAGGEQYGSRDDTGKGTLPAPATQGRYLPAKEQQRRAAGGKEARGARGGRHRKASGPGKEAGLRKDRTAGAAMSIRIPGKPIENGAIRAWRCKTQNRTDRRGSEKERYEGRVRLRQGVARHGPAGAGRKGSGAQEGSGTGERSGAAEGPDGIKKKEQQTGRSAGRGQ